LAHHATATLPPSQRSAVTNDPLALPPALLLTTSAGRRWRDLAVSYAEQLGPERMTREDVRARLRSLIWITVELERLHDERVCDRPVPLHTMLHLAQEQRALIAELGLGAAHATTAPSVADYVAAVADDEVSE
jgi:hypothetical protein